MIVRCDFCGKIFDTDYEDGTVINGLTCCEDCKLKEKGENENEDD